ncbi:ubiquitin-specific protease otu1 [Puttea exsequens]|nr:ubiquitin-specific protease otu1 [Puttea exsequens]
MRLRIRGPAGQSTITLPDTATVEDLKSQITVKTSVSSFDIKYGYPPQPLSLAEYTGTTNLQDTGLKLEGEQLIISASVPQPHKPLPRDSARHPEPDASKYSANGTKSIPKVAGPSSFPFADVGTAPPPSQAQNKPLSLSRAPTVSEQDAPEIPLSAHNSTLVLRIMPDDNSCLFRAFNTAFFGAMDNMHELRSIIAQYIQANKNQYPAVVLEKEPDDYCRWIQTQDAWGGAIELDILSRHFDIEICSIDVQTLRTDKFNEGRKERCILVYSGIHYDTIALSPSDPPHKHAYNSPDFDTKIFPAAEDFILEKAVDLCKVLQERHYFTNTASFSVKCNTCGTLCVGEKGAQEHATKTGHWDFGEAA